MSSVKCKQCGMVNWSTSPSCKRCGAELTGSANDLPAPVVPVNTSYPQGRLPHQVKEGDTIKSCIHCGREVGLTKWDSWNGFLVQCPNCGGLHGKHWNIRLVLLASLLFNAFSFLFTMRLARAVPALLAFIVVVVVTNFFLDSEAIPDLVEIAIGSVILLGPMLINAIVLMKHERDLDDSAPPTRALHQ